MLPQLGFNNPLLGQTATTTSPTEPVDSRTGVQAPLLPGGTTSATGTTDTTAGGTGGTGTVTAPVGPSAAQIAGYNNYLGSVQSTAAANTSGAANDLLNDPYGVTVTKGGLQIGQNKVDQEGVQANLAATQGRQGILDMIHNGLASGAVKLNSANAANSSAADALARAYSVQGRQAGAQVGNQFAQAQAQQGIDQANQNIAVNDAQATLGAKKQDAINNIVTTAQQALQWLSLQEGGANMSPDQQVNVGQQAATIKANALAALSQYDDQIAHIGGTPMSAQDQADKAASMAFAGTPPENAYSFTNVAPAAFQGQPSPAPLPIFTAPGASKKIGALA